MSEIRNVVLWTSETQIGLQVEVRHSSANNTNKAVHAMLSCDKPTDTSQFLIFIGKMKEMVESL